jgi:fatty aldehyde-generating acyl-ACP reductase
MTPECTVLAINQQSPTAHRIGGSLRKFAFLIHPLDLGDVEKFESGARGRSEALVKKMLIWICERPPFVGSQITGIRSKTGAKAEGWFIVVPLLAEQMIENPKLARKKILEAVGVGKDLGASIVGLGGFTSIAVNGGLGIADDVDIPLTSGNSYTVVAAIEGTKKAARLMGIKLSKAQGVIIGATGSIGRACTEILAGEVDKLCLVGRRVKVLESQAKRLKDLADISVSTDIKKSLIGADFVITASNDAHAIISTNDLEPGTIVCDVAQPPDVFHSVMEERDDVLVFEGGIIRIPGLRIKRERNYKYDFNLRSERSAYACMAETMILCLEGVDEHFGLGGVKISNTQVIAELAEKHGFKLTGFRSFGKRVTKEQIREIRRNAAKKSNKKWFYRIRRRMEYM